MAQNRELLRLRVLSEYPEVEPPHLHVPVVESDVDQTFRAHNPKMHLEPWQWHSQSRTLQQDGVQPIGGQHN
eukprot:7380725-Ditylum_brightwellii.AAC.1